MASSIDISSVVRMAGASAQTVNQAHGEPTARQQELSVADTVRLSSEARKRMDELTESQTVAEAFLKHLLESNAAEASRAESGKNFEDEETASKVKGAFDRMVVDLGWLIDALGVPAEESTKLRAVLAARASVDYATARPPVPELVSRATAEGAVPALYVRDLAITVSSDSVDNASVQKVAVMHANPTLTQQFSDPNTPRVVVVANQGSAGAEGAQAAFHDNLTGRLAHNPDIQGMLIVREYAVSGEHRRVLVDALMPLEAKDGK